MKYRIAAGLLFFLATIKVLADILGWTSVSAIAAMSNVAPAMKVFTSHKGYETYSSKYQLSVRYKDNSERVIVLNPNNYGAIKGPYNRRNVYGALIAYGPILYKNPQTQGMWVSMARKSFCHDSHILNELGFDHSKGVTSARIDYLETRNPQNYAHYLEINCAGDSL